ncbi:OTU-domain-containing protein [Ascobolus immersus RN42]|uniref:OTU-domain-containing protein n=1 Tax=Ascobolus immersus RN42 TaxID=1160509 RepID=A0A3N4HZ42_ASCIM|nr:OTU-domain-containing protein [Ascobolus immersus RN42]
MDFEALQQKHRKELRDLQATITSKKKSATKKTRRGINAECEALERELKERQAQELAELDGPTQSTTSDQEEQEEPESKPEAESEQTPDLSSLTISEPDPKSTPEPPQAEPQQPQQQQQRKPNRQKARLARRAAEQEAAIEKAALEAQSIPNLKKKEQAALQAQFDKLGLEQHDITPDGHCLYSAFSHQLSLLGEVPREGEKEGYKACREKAAAFMESHREDFEPFLGDVDGGFDEYVKKVRDTAEWGGQLEVLALARAYGVVARIVQGEGRVEVLNEDGDKEKEVWLAYYRHIYSLGEHYNSLVKVEKS